MRQHYLLGQAFRRHYVDNLHFLPPEFDPSLMDIRSNDYNRSLTSAEAHLLGFFPPNTIVANPMDHRSTNHQTSHLNDPSLIMPPMMQKPSGYKGEKDVGDWQSMRTIAMELAPPQLSYSVRVVPHQDDFLLNSFNPIPCASMKKFRDDQLKTVESQRNIGEAVRKGAFENVRNVFNISEKDFTLERASWLSDEVVLNYYSNKSLPLDYHDPAVDTLTKLENYVLAWAFLGDHHELKGVATPLLRELLSRIDDRVTNRTTFKWIMISGQDINIWSLLFVMNQSKTLPSLIKEAWLIHHS